MARELPNAKSPREVAAMINSLIPALPLSSGMDSIPSLQAGTPPSSAFFTAKQPFRKLSVFKRNSIGMQIAIRYPKEYKRISVSLRTTIGSQTDTSLKSESYLLSFAD
jgi:hypothetical protein